MFIVCQYKHNIHLLFTFHLYCVHNVTLCKFQARSQVPPTAASDSNSLVIELIILQHYAKGYVGILHMS